MQLTITDAALPVFRKCMDNAFQLAASPVLDHRKVGLSFFHCLRTIINLGANSTNQLASISKDFEPLSFTFSAGSLTGGMIFHGPENPASLSVQLTPTHGWQLHT
jgi:hypothetical protein